MSVLEHPEDVSWPTGPDYRERRLADFVTLRIGGPSRADIALFIYFEGEGT